ncbi:hypothetical protein GCM10027062_28730 [Nocardioides hungaricus]
MRRTAITALAAASLLLAGCGGDPQAEPGGTPTSSTPTEPTEPTRSEPTAPVVEPATGFTFDLERITMRAPEGWRKTKAPASFLLGADDPKTVSTIILSDLMAVRDQPLAGQVRIALKSTPQLKVQEPVEIAGVKWYHLAGRDDQYATLDSFGTIYNDSEAVIDFSLDNDLSADKKQQIIDSVLATVEWK